MTNTTTITAIAVGTFALGSAVTACIANFKIKRADRKATQAERDRKMNTSVYDNLHLVRTQAKEYSMHSDRAETFTKLYDKVDSELEVKDSWHNGTGYFDPLTKDTTIPVGIHKAYCKEGKRRLLICKIPETDTTAESCVVVFDRYSNCEGGVITFNHSGNPIGVPGGHTPTVAFMETHFK